MEVLEVSQKANTLQVKFKYTHAINSTILLTKSPQYVCGALYTEFDFRSSQSKNYNNGWNEFGVSVSVRFHKLLDDDDFTYTCKIESTVKDLLVGELKICDDHWHPIAFYKAAVSLNSAFEYTFDVILNCELYTGPQSIFVSLYDDTESADFKLCGDDGTVQIHRMLLAAHSPVLQSMLAGEWKESQEGSVALQGVSLDTLQHLKDYIYLNRLPETGLQELCLLASYYMIPRLALLCCAKLLNYLTTENVIEIAEFASTYRVRSLFNAILKTMGGEKAKIETLNYKTDWFEVCKKINSTE